jgi:hypothetical protein
MVRLVLAVVAGIAFAMTMPIAAQTFQDQIDPRSVIAFVPAGDRHLRSAGGDLRPWGRQPGRTATMSCVDRRRLGAPPGDLWRRNMLRGETITCRNTRTPPWRAPASTR